MRIIIAAIVLAWFAGWFSHGYFMPAYYDMDNHHLPAPASPYAEQPTVHKTIIETKIAGETTVSQLQLFQKLLMQNDFSAALAAWPDANKQQARNMIFRHSNKLNHAGKIAASMRLLNEYYNFFPDDSEAGILYANILHQSHRFYDETFLLMGMLYKTSDMSLLENIKKRLQNTINSYTKNIMKAGKNSDLLNYYRRLSNLDGANQNYYLKQASILIDMGLLQQASAILQPLLFDPEARHQAKILSAKINKVTSTQYQTSITLKRSGEHFLVPVSINGNPPIQLLLDTGASITLIQQQALAKSDEKHQLITLQTANGRIQIPLTEGNEISIGGYHLPAIKIGLVAEPLAIHAQGLLGMNILKHFDFFIDQEEPALKLNLR